MSSFDFLDSLFHEKQAEEQREREEREPVYLCDLHREQEEQQQGRRA